MDNRHHLIDDITKSLFHFLPMNKMGLFALTAKNSKKLIRDALLVRLLHHTAYSNQTEVEKILNFYPELLLEKGTTTDPARNTLKDITAFECALGAGDYYMAVMMASYFSKLPDGDNEKAKQFAPYKLVLIYPELSKRWKTSWPSCLIKENSYDFQPLLDALRRSTLEDINAVLNKDVEHNSELMTVMREFKNAFSPRVIKAGEMHCNTISLLQILNTFSLEWVTLQPEEMKKYQSIWQEITAYVMQALPACDRQAFGGTLSDAIADLRPHSTSFKSGNSYKLLRKFNMFSFANNNPIDMLYLNADEIAPQLAFDKHAPSFYFALYSIACGVKKFEAAELMPKPTASWCMIS